MANFRTHIAGAAIPSVAAAGTLFAADLIPAEIAVAAAFLGALGGILPDIDAERSLPTRIIFGALALAGACALALALRGQIALPLLGALVLGAFLLLRFGLRALTGWLCVHRGLVHTLPMAALVGVVVADLAAFVAPSDHAWLLGAFTSAGFIVHLVLDELFSVDLLGVRLKASFGTALKLGIRRQPIGTLVLYAALVGVVVLGPPIDRFARQITSQRTHRAIAGVLHLR
ncbi:MAG: metal-dependent hydrolase [Nannocystis sp.]|nr:metal-dependent hydrolase [Nannocystis sp.]